jgi:hypothetical protein
LDRSKAKNESSFPVKGIDQIKGEEELQIYLIPRTDCHLYLIYYGQKESVLLKGGVASENIEMALSEVNQFYQLEKMTNRQAITIISVI